jgi:hypothetical protein
MHRHGHGSSIALAGLAVLALMFQVLAYRRGK